LPVLFDDLVCGSLLVHFRMLEASGLYAFPSSVLVYSSAARVNNFLTLLWNLSIEVII
jgi:hypothetical protein